MACCMKGKEVNFLMESKTSTLQATKSLTEMTFLRAYLAFTGNPRDARQKGKEVLFRLKNFEHIIDSVTKL